jgi:RND family efflux transporter MFP subunit
MKKVLIFPVVLVVVALGWFFLGRLRPGAAEESAARPAASVETVPLAEQAIARTIEAFGTVVAAPSGDSLASAPYDCVVRKVYVAVGSAVAAGDVLLEVDPSPEAKLAADSARSVRTLADKALAATQQRYDLKLATSQELFTAEQAAEDARLKADSLAARGLGGDGRIIAAAAGVVTRLDLGPGALAPAGTPLVTVSAGGRWEVRLGVEAADAAAVRAGQAVTLASANRSAPANVPATVRSVGAALDPATGAVEVRAPVPADAPLLLGEHVQARIEIQRQEHALVVPRRAVLPDGEKQVLFTVKDGQAVRHEVQTGLATDELLEVTGPDLHAGDPVVVLGNYELEDGMAIQAPAPATPAGEARGSVRPAPEAKP